MYIVKYEKSVIKTFKKLDSTTQKFILQWITKHLYHTTNPRLKGKQLIGNKRDYWRYRIGDYRLIVKIKDAECIILAIHVGHRKEVYK